MIYRSRYQPISSVFDLSAAFVVIIMIRWTDDNCVSHVNYALIDRSHQSQKLDWGVICFTSGKVALGSVMLKQTRIRMKYPYIEAVWCIYMNTAHTPRSSFHPPPLVHSTAYPLRPYLVFDRRHVVTQNHDRKFFMIRSGQWIDKSVGTRRWVLSWVAIIIISSFVFCYPRKSRSRAETETWPWLRFKRTQAQMWEVEEEGHVGALIP